MLSYQARLKEAQRAIIADMSRDIVSTFGLILEPHGFTKTSHSYDKDWELITVTFKDPVRKDSVDIVCDHGSHRFSANYFVPNQDYEEDTLEETGPKTFSKKLAPWLEGLGWECETCEGEGTLWPDEPEDEGEGDEGDESHEDETADTIPVDEQLLTCPHCGGSGKTRKLVEKSEAA